MQLLKTAFLPNVSPTDISPDSNLTLITRHAARGIIVRGEDIRLLYTRRINQAKHKRIMALAGSFDDETADGMLDIIKQSRRNKN